ncbi:LOW QUALITY PROTEIN: hypothetical protein Ct61P_14612 [Colletotrichum tofieldiae]|nr:LOW QUALITY PROTEIN: hypothetical protein Ct61P_14612 [Colletotrichum tofieldiae]
MTATTTRFEIESRSTLRETGILSVSTRLQSVELCFHGELFYSDISQYIHLGASPALQYTFASPSLAAPGLSCYIHDVLDILDFARHSLGDAAAH